MRNSGSRNSTPGNIWVESTAVVKVLLPLKFQRETPYAANVAMTSENSVATVQTTSELTKYFASGTVDHMSMNGWKVMFVGIHVKSFCTSPSGFMAVVIMT